jgi:hypothetical protein
LHAALKGFTERDLSLTQLQEAAWVIVQSYREAGWLAHALVPEQEIEGGVVTLRVIEARLGQVRTEFPEGTKLPRQHIEAMAQAHLAQGQPINLNQLDRLIVLLGDLPGVVANASFVQGKLDLSTDVRIAISQSKALDASITTDNFGAISTGRTRISANILASNPADLGDALQLQGVATDGSRYTPVGAADRYLLVPLTGNPNIELFFTRLFPDTISNSGNSVVNPDIFFQVFTQGSGTAPLIPTGSGSNPGSTTVTINNGTGEANGSFTLVDQDPTRPTGAMVSRTGTWYGRAIRPAGVTPMKAFGYYIVPELPAPGFPPTTVTNSPIVSGDLFIQRH